MMTKLKHIISEVMEFARDKLPQDILHGWPHIERVLKYASMINEEINANWDVVHCSVLLHDIGHNINRKKHNIISAEMAEKFLLLKKIDQDSIINIKNSILAHSRQFSETKPESLEAKVLYDADGMDLFGPIGLMRVLLSCGLRDKGFDCMIKKLNWRITEIPNFYSNMAKKFINQNSKIIIEYLGALKQQLEFFDKLKGV